MIAIECVKFVDEQLCLTRFGAHRGPTQPKQKQETRANVDLQVP
jgi:hypothetical protein